MLSLAVRALLSRVPGIVWVALLALAFIVAGGYGIYRRGVSEGAVKVHSVALADSVTHAVAAVDTARRKSDSTVAIARTAVVSSSTGRQQTREILAAAKDSTPATVISAVEQQLAKDSTTIAIQSASIDTLLAERVTRVQLDTLQEHQLVLKPPDGGLSVKEIVGGVGVVVMIVELARLVMHLLGR